MGKNKASRNKRGGHKVAEYSKSSRPNDLTDSGHSVDPPSKLITKLRSTDRSVRHSTLAALLHTTFHASALSSYKKNGHKNLNRPLLQAIRDQIVACDPLPPEASAKQIAAYKEQLRCSVLATECLGNYVCYSNDDEEDSHEGAWVAGWILIFMQRIQDFIDCNSLSTEAHRPVHDMHLDLVEQCIIAMVHLFERNPLAMDRLRVVQQPYRSNVLDIHGILTFLLQHTNSILTPMNTTATNRCHVYQSIQLHAARCLHSIWDDNIDFVASFLLPSQIAQKSVPSSSKTTLEILNTLIVNTWNTLTGPKSMVVENESALATTIVTGLHACGACMAAWLALHAREEQATPLLDGCIPMCIQLVGRVIMNGSPDQSFLWGCMKGLEGPVHAAHLSYLKEQMDTQLEDTVLHQQHKKMESARSIARRLKQMKATAASDNMETNENDSKVESSKKNGSDSKVASHTCQSTEYKIDPTGRWEEIQMEWYDAVRPIELAVELVANWSSPCTSVSRNASSTQMNDVDMSMEEDDAMIDAQFHESKPAFPSELIVNLKNFQISMAIRELFTFLTDWYKRLIHSPLIPEAPIIILDSLGDLIYKTIAAMEGCETCEGVAEPLRSGGQPSYLLWNLLKSFLLDILTSSDSSYQDMNVRLQSASTGSMVSLLRYMSQRPPDRSTKEEDPVWVRNVFCDLLSMMESKVTDLSENPVVRDFVCMTGIVVCGFPKSVSSADVFKLTRLLMSLTAPNVDPSSQATEDRISMMVLSEVLNVLMDVFSEDDFHTNVFDQLNVSLYFEQMIPVLKREMQCYRLHRPSDGNMSTEDMMEHCQETAANATRFVKYKKDLRQK